MTSAWLRRTAFVSMVHSGFALALLAWPTPPRPQPGPVLPEPVRKVVARPSLRFVPNQGQAPQGVLFTAAAAGYHLRLRASGAEMWLSGGPQVRLRLRGARAVAAAGADPQATRYSYFYSRRAIRNVPSFARVIYRQVYPGVDLVFGSRAGRLEYDWRIAAGANARAIQLRLEGYQGIAVSQAGDIVLRTPDGEVRMLRPRAFQGRRAVAVTYRLMRGGRVSLRLGRYDRNRALVIDPFIVFQPLVTPNSLPTAVAVDQAGNAWVAGNGVCEAGDAPVYVAEYAASGEEEYDNSFGSCTGNPPSLGADVGGIAVDGSGNVYVTGATLTKDFPGTFQARSLETLTGAYLFELNPASDQLVFAGMLDPATGNGCYDFASPAAVTLDVSGNIFVAGSIPASGCSEATTTPILATTDSGAAYDSTRLLSTYVNGAGVLSGPFNAGSSAGLAFVAELAYNATTQALTSPFNTLFGGGGYAAATSVAVASGGYGPELIYLAGDAQAADTAFPLVHGLPNQYAVQGGVFSNDAVEGFVAGISTTATGHSLMFSTLIPGTQSATGVAYDAWGNVFVTGTTGQSNSGCGGGCGALPGSLVTFSQEFEGSLSLNPPQAPLPGNSGSPVQAYVWSFNPESPDGVTSPGLTTGYATVLGQQDGQGNPVPSAAYGLTLDAGSNAYVVGATLAGVPQKVVNPVNYFITEIQPLPNAENGPSGITGLDAFAYDFTAQQLTPFPLCASCVSTTAGLQAVAWGGAVAETQTTAGNPGSICATGYTSSGQGLNGDLVCLGAGAPEGLASLTAAANPLNFGEVYLGETSALLDATLANLGTAPLAISTIGVSGPNGGDFLLDPSSTCPLTGGSLAAGASCTIALAFRPSVAAPETATLVAADNSGGNPSATQTLGLTGQGEASLSVFGSGQSGAIDFGTIAIDRPSHTATISVENTSNQPVNMNGAIAPSQFAGNFHVLAETCSSLVNGAVPPSGNCTFPVYFEPTFDAGTAEAANFVVTAGLGALNFPPQTIALGGISGGNYGPQPLPEMVSVDNEVSPQPATGGSFSAAVSGGGSEVAFIANTYNTDLPGAGGGVTGLNGLWVRYTCNGGGGCGQDTEFIAYGPTAGPAANGGVACLFSNLGYNQGATSPAITPDGRFVAFNDDGCANSSSGSGAYGPSQAYTYLRDLQGQTTTAPLLDSGGNPLAGGAVTMSSDARFFAFTSLANAVVAGVTGVEQQIYLRDTCQSEGAAVAGCTPANVLVSQDPSGQNIADNSGAPGQPFVSPDGRYVAFTSSATNLLAITSPLINSSNQQVYLRDACAGARGGCTPTTLLVSADNAGNPGNSGSFPVGVSAGGRYVAFISGATNLPGAPAALAAGGNEVYLRDTCQGAPAGCQPTTTLVSLNFAQPVPSAAALIFNGQIYGAASSGGSISADGRVVGFNAAPALTAPAAGVQSALYAYDTCLSNGVEVPGCSPSLHAVSAVMQNGQPVLVGGNGPVDPSGQFAIYPSGAPSEIWLNGTGVTVSAAPRILTATLPGGTAGRAYSQAISATGGTGALAFTVSSFYLPAGLSLDAATGVISGTPTQAGTFNFTVTATDSTGLTGSQNYQVTITCPTIAFINLSAPLAKYPLTLYVGQPIDDQFGATTYDAQSFGQNGTPNTFAQYLSLTGGGAPPGMSFNNSTGQLTGTPATPGSYTLDLKASGGGCSADSGGDFGLQVVTPCAAPAAAAVSRGGYSKRFGTTIYSQLVTVTYTGSATLSGGLAYVIAGLPAGVTVANAGGTTTCTAPAGSAYIVLSAGAVAPGASFSFVVQFNDPAAAGISYSPQVVGGGTP